MNDHNFHTEHPEGLRPASKAEMELGRREAQWRALVENTPDVITRWNSELKLVFANTAFEEKTGKPVADVLGKTNIEMGVPADIAIPYMAKLRRAFDSGQSQEHYNQFPGPQGEICFHSRIVPELATDGTVYTVLVIARDITNLKNKDEEISELNRRLQRKIRESELLGAELYAFKKVASDHYGNAIQKAYTSLEFLISNDARNLTNEGRASLRRVQSSLQRIKLMTDDLLAYLGIEGNEESFTNVDLNQVLEIVKGEMENKLERAGATVTAAQLPVVKGHAMLISMLFYHLLDNAAKFGDRAQIILQYNLIDRHGPEGDLQYHVISFTDNGIGFNEQQAAGIFELFNRHADRQRYKGSGIGLAVGKKIMDLHGGFMTYESTEGEGSMFSCWFPF